MEKMEKYIKAIKKFVTFERLEFIKIGEFDIYHFMVYEGEAKAEILVSESSSSSNEISLYMIRK